VGEEGIGHVPRPHDFAIASKACIGKSLSGLPPAVLTLNPYRNTILFEYGVAMATRTCEAASAAGFLYLWCREPESNRHVLVDTRFCS
jgi:hypothetical protein